MKKFFGSKKEGAEKRPPMPSGMPRMQNPPPPPGKSADSSFNEWKFKQTDSVSEAVKFMNENRIDPAFMFQSASEKISIIYN